jgi:hypothetical protein
MLPAFCCCRDSGSPVLNATVSRTVVVSDPCPSRNTPYFCTDSNKKGFCSGRHLLLSCSGLVPSVTDECFIAAQRCTTPNALRPALPLYNTNLFPFPCCNMQAVLATRRPSCCHLLSQNPKCSCCLLLVLCTSNMARQHRATSLLA